MRSKQSSYQEWLSLLIFMTHNLIGEPMRWHDDKSDYSHTADSLTTGESDTWWQSQTMYSGDIEYPNNVTLTLDLHKVNFLKIRRPGVPGIPDRSVWNGSGPSKLDRDRKIGSGPSKLDRAVRIVPDRQNWIGTVQKNWTVGYNPIGPERSLTLSL